MNKQLVSIIATLLIFQLAAVAAQTAGDEIAESQSAPASAAPVPAAGAEKASTEQKIPEPASDTVTPPTAGADDEAQVPAAKTETDKVPGPITGAFGIALGKRFEPSMVARVLGEQEQAYRGPDGAKLKGALFRVEPVEPDERFQRYSIKTTDKGIIYAIQGDYQFEVEQGKGKQVKVKKSRVVRSTCKDAVKALARELEASYGKPRGKGWDGEWFAFRQLSDTSNISLRLYGNRCRSGMYSVIFTDEKVQRGTPPDKASTK